ncbi:MAG: hypothetical protein DRI75_09945 [Bacteroidetes bacterium]|nr:MAG: hypothetical protein DRI75_09945 [Bacteroidota bacterium]
MKKLIKDGVSDVFSWANLKVEKLNEKEKVIELIKKLYPVLTDRKLVRFGPKGDGGYLIPDDIDGIEACFSPGVGNLSGFEKDCFKNGMEVFLADKSVNSPEGNNDEFNFIKKFIGPISNDSYITMDDWVLSSLNSKNSDLLLQMDIEGYEYSTILNMSNALLKRFRIVVIEFHSLNKLWDKEFFNIVSLVFEKLLHHHTCLHIHPNNCCGISNLKGIEIPKVAEFTFIRNNRINKREPQINFPHLLDFDCVEEKKTIVLPKAWYSVNNN